MRTLAAATAAIGLNGAAPKRLAERRYSSIARSSCQMSSTLAV